MFTVIIKRLINTEKSFEAQAKNTFTFEVDPSANKIQIAAEAERLFSAKVVGVTTTTQRKKSRRLRGSRVHVRRPQSKIARITFKQGESIDFSKVNK